MNSSTDQNNRWICPNDRVLSLRAKLDVGWSVRANQLDQRVPSPSSSSSTVPISSSPSSSTLTPMLPTMTVTSLSASPYASTLTLTSSSSQWEVSSTISSSGGGHNVTGGQQQPKKSSSSTTNQVNSCLSEEEQQHVLSVIERAKQVEQMEKERLFRLTDRLKNMKRNSGGDGKGRCALCNEKFPFLSLKSTSFECRECLNWICTKCVVDQVNTWTNETIYYCKVCSETREIWKKSGAWFLKGLPTFPLISEPTNSNPSTPRTSLSSTSSSSNNNNVINNFNKDNCSNTTRTFNRSNCPPPITTLTKLSDEQSSKHESPPNSADSRDSYNSLDTSITLSNFSINQAGLIGTSSEVPPSPAPATPFSVMKSPLSLHKRNSSIRRSKVIKGDADSLSIRSFRTRQRQARQEQPQDNGESSSSIGSVESLVERMHRLDHHEYPSTFNEDEEEGNLEIHPTTPFPPTNMGKILPSQEDPDTETSGNKSFFVPSTYTSLSLSCQQPRDPTHIFNSIESSQGLSDVTSPTLSYISSATESTTNTVTSSDNVKEKVTSRLSLNSSKILLGSSALASANGPSLSSSLKKKSKKILPQPGGKNSFFSSFKNRSSSQQPKTATQQTEQQPADFSSGYYGQHNMSVTDSSNYSCKYDGMDGINGIDGMDGIPPESLPSSHSTGYFRYANSTPSSAYNPSSYSNPSRTFSTCAPTITTTTVPEATCSTDTTTECWQLCEDDTPGLVKFNLVRPERKSSLTTSPNMMMYASRRSRPF